MPLVNYIHKEDVFLEDGKIEFFIPDYELLVTLVNVKRKSGSGASYAKSWEYVPENCMMILRTWLAHYFLSSRAWKKKDLREELIRWGVYINEDPMNARMSELLGLGLITMSKNEKDSTFHTRVVPEYRLVLDKVATVVKNKGKL